MSAPPAILTRNLLRTWRIFFVLAALQGLLGLGALMLSPSEAGSRFLFGFSATRWVSLLLALLIVTGFVWLLLRSWTRPEWTHIQAQRVASIGTRPRLWASLTIVFGFLVAGGIFFISLTPEIEEPFTQVLFSRLLPFVIVSTGLSIQTLVLLVWLRLPHPAPGQRSAAWSLAVPLALIGGIFLLWSWVARTTLAGESQVVGWNDTGIPVLELQVLAAWLLGMLFLPIILLVNSTGKDQPESSSRKAWVLDLVLIIVIWLGTIWLWSSATISPSWFVSEPRPPNYEPYPNSDALAYDMTAQQLLVGEGLQFDGYSFIRRPIHAVYLTLLHSLVGQNYAQLIFGQILILAWIPAIIYLIARRLHTQLAGIIVAVLIALREANAISLAGTITSAHSKSLMADLPAMLAVVCFVHVALIWLQQAGINPTLGLLSGGLLGIAGLIRPELLGLVVGVALVLVLTSTRRWRRWLSQLALFSIGLVLVLIPWVYRNWALTGQIFLDNPTFRLEWIEERLESQAFPPGENASAPSSSSPAAQTPAVAPTTAALVRAASTPTPNTFSTQNSALSSLDKINSLLQANFSRLALGSASHFANSLIQIVLILPSTFRPLDSLVGYFGHRDANQLWYECCSALGYVRRLPYWHKWDGNFPAQAAVPLAINVIFISLGIAQSWKRLRWIGLFPAVLSLVHISINALVRNSGGRYILPLDWVGLLYFSIGLAAVSLWLVQLFTGRRSIDCLYTAPLSLSADLPSLLSPWRSPAFYAAAAALIIAGAAAPILERAIPTRYTAAHQAEMLQELFNSPLLSSEDRSALQEVIDQGGVVLAGRSLYPRFYRFGEGEPGTNNPLSSAPYRRIGFYLAGPVSSVVILPDQRQPAYFPNGADVLVIGCQTGDPLGVAIFNGSSAPAVILLKPDHPSSLACPTGNTIPGEN